MLNQSLKHIGHTYLYLRKANTTRYSGDTETDLAILSDKYYNSLIN